MAASVEFTTLGPLLVIEPEALDSVRSRAVASRAWEPAPDIRELQTALTLWRGDAGAELDHVAAAMRRSDLDELRQHVEERLMFAQLVDGSGDPKLGMRADVRQLERQRRAESLVSTTGAARLARRLGELSRP